MLLLRSVYKNELIRNVTSTSKAIIFFIQILSPPLRIPQIPQNWAMIDKFGFLERLCSFWILQKVLNRLVDEGMQHWSNIEPFNIVGPVIVIVKMDFNSVQITCQMASNFFR